MILVCDISIVGLIEFDYANIFYAQHKKSLLSFEMVLIFSVRLRIHLCVIVESVSAVKMGVRYSMAVIFLLCRDLDALKREKKTHTQLVIGNGITTATRCDMHNINITKLKQCRTDSRI